MNDDTKKDEFLTVEQAAVVLQVSETTMRKELRDGRIPARKVGREWRVSRRVLEAYVSGAHLPTTAN